MKKLSILMLLAAASYALTGCILTDYPCITDTENPNYGECTMTTGNILHDTQGFAHITDPQQSMNVADPDDGYVYEFLAFVSQNSLGIHQLGTLAQKGLPPGVYHSDLYGNVPRAGIADAMFAWAYTGVDPVTGYPTITGDCAAEEADQYDYVLTTNCPEAINAVKYIVYAPGRTNEVGRSLVGHDGRFPAQARLAFLRAGTPVADGLQYTFNTANVSLNISQAGGYSKNLDLNSFNGRSFLVDPTQDSFVLQSWLTSIGVTGADVKALWAQVSDLNRNLPVTATVTLYGQTFANTVKIAPTLDYNQFAETLGAVAGSGGVGDRRDR